MPLVTFTVKRRWRGEVLYIGDFVVSYGGVVDYVLFYVHCKHLCSCQDGQ